MLRMAKAQLHLKRTLDDAELATIAGALEYFATVPPIEQQLEAMAPYDDEQLPLCPDGMRALARELTTARKVKVCRSKQPQP